MMKHGYKRFFEGRTKKRIECCKIKDGFLCAIQGHSGGIPIEPELLGYVIIPRKWKRYILHRGPSWNYQSILGHGLIPGRKEKDKARQAVFPTPTNPFGNDPEEEERHDDNTVPQKVPCGTHWKHDQNAVFLGTIIKTAGSRIGILADEVICNHDLRYDTRRLH